MDRPEGRRVRKFDGPSGRGLWIALRAMLIKSALRDLLSVSYSMISILVISRCAAPPYPATPDFLLCRGQNKAPLCCELLMKGLLCGPLLSHRSAGGRWWRQPPKGDCISSPIRAVVKVLYKLAPSII